MRRAWLWFAAVFVCHSTVQFVAWSGAVFDPSYRLAWQILSAPTFAVFGKLATTVFWPLMVANSALWAAPAALVVRWLNSGSASAR